jgi:hypothetical protein
MTGGGPEGAPGPATKGSLRNLAGPGAPSGPAPDYRVRALISSRMAVHSSAEL